MEGDNLSIVNKCTTVVFRAVNYIEVQSSAVHQYSAVLCSVANCNEGKCSAVQFTALHRSSAVQCSAAQFNRELTDKMSNWG